MISSLEFPPLLTAETGFRWELAALFAGIYLQAILATLVKRRADMPAVQTLVIALFMGCGWCVLAAIDLITQSLDGKLLLFRLGALFIPFIPVVWLETVHRLVRGRPLLYGPRLVAISVIPMISIVLIWTSDFHALYRHDFTVVAAGGFMALQSERGPWDLVAMLYGAGVTLAIFWLLWGWVPRISKNPWGIRLALVALAALPLAAEVLSLLDAGPLNKIDYLSIAVAFSASGLTWGLIRLRVVDLSHTSRRSLVERLKDLLIVIDRQNRIVDINAPACQLLGTERGSVVGWNALEVLSVWPSVVRHLSTAGEESGEVVLPGESGENVAYEMVVVPIESVGDNGGGNPAARLIILRDISSHKKVEEELRRAKSSAEEADRAKSRFLAMMSHEIRTPMNAVVGFAEILKASQLSPEQAEYVDLIAESGESLLVIIDDLLDYSKIETGQIVLEHAPFGLHDKVSAVSRLMLPRAKAKGLEFFWEIDPEVPTVALGDGGRVGQVLLNLVGNAIKFTPDGEIQLRVRTVRHQRVDLPRDSCVVEFSVEDTGIGVAPNMSERIFQPFSQAVDRGELDQNSAGTGLGLAISRKLCELMGGELQMTPRVGGGSIFSFTAVFALPPQETASTLLPEPEPVEYGTLRLLVVEHSAVNRRLLATILRRAGHIVEVAENGTQALDLIVDQRFDVILLDLEMPDFDGLKTARAIRDEESLRRAKRATHLIGMSPQSNAAESDRCRKAGMDDLVTRPINPDALRTALSRVPPKRKTTTPSDLGLEEYF